MNQKHQFIDNWKNGDVSQKQLALNLRELHSTEMYPEHWNIFLNYISSNKVSSILDVGCGVGAYASLIKHNNLDVEYTGIDYSENAIEIARQQWDFGKFTCMDYRELTEDFVSNFELLHLGALLDVLPNGDEALQFIISTNPRILFISRIILTKEPSNFKTYDAYDTITTYSYRHNQKKLVTLFEENGYDLEFISNNIIAIKKTQP